MMHLDNTKKEDVNYLIYVHRIKDEVFETC